MDIDNNRSNKVTVTVTVAAAAELLTVCTLAVIGRQSCPELTCVAAAAAVANTCIKASFFLAEHTT